MHPVLAQIGPFAIYTHGVAVALAVLAGGLAARRSALPSTPWLVAAAIVGARLLPAWHGGLLGFAVATVVCARVQRSRLRVLADAVAAPGLLAFAVERGGAFVASGDPVALQVAVAALLGAVLCAILARRARVGFAAVLAVVTMVVASWAGARTRDAVGVSAATIPEG